MHTCLHFSLLHARRRNSGCQQTGWRIQWHTCVLDMCTAFAFHWRCCVCKWGFREGTPMCATPVSWKLLNMQCDCNTWYYQVSDGWEILWHFGSWFRLWLCLEVAAASGHPCNGSGHAAFWVGSCVWAHGSGERHLDIHCQHLNTSNPGLDALTVSSCDRSNTPTNSSISWLVMFLAPELTCRLKQQHGGLSMNKMSWAEVLDIPTSYFGWYCTLCSCARRLETARPWMDLSLYSRT